MKRSLVVLFNLIFSITCIANVINVSTIVNLQTAITNASNGDTIILANGTYLNNTLTIASNNITIMPTTIGGAFLNGTNSINISGNNIIFEGFQFITGNITGSAITVNGNNNKLSQLNFNGYSAAHMIMINGQLNTVEYCNFENKPATSMVNHGGSGDMVQIIPNSSIVGYNTIRYCSFQHMPGFGGDYGNECIRIGDGAYSTYISRTVVEYCYFEDTGNGDSEAISVKSRENCLRNNTMYNNPNAMFSFRNGDNNVAYSNFFIKSGGIRCKQSNNIFCYNNYFEQSGVNQNSSLPGSGVAPVSLEYYGTGYGANFNFIHNTFYQCIDCKIASSLTNCAWANNIFYADTSVVFSGTTSGQSFSGNIYQGSIGLTISSGMNNGNPLLTKNSSGYYSISTNSPAIKAASASYPAILSINGLNNDPTILYDIAGENRPSLATLKDVGCSQYPNGEILNHPLSICETGPTYLCTTTSIPQKVDNTVHFNIFPNPSNGFFTILLPISISNVIITNMLGEIIQKEVSNSNSIDCQLEKKGIYFITINTAFGSQTSKVVIN